MPQTLVMRTAVSVPSCDQSGFACPDPLTVPSPLSSFLSDAPSQNPTVPQTQVRAARGKDLEVSGQMPVLTTESPFVPWHCGSKRLCRAELTEPELPRRSAADTPGVCHPGTPSGLPCTFQFNAASCFHLSSAPSPAL